MFGRLASWIARRRRLDDPEEFAQVIRSFVASLTGKPWPHVSNRNVVLLNKVHEWSKWLANAGMVLQGYTGPTAPRVFSFARRAACEAQCASLEAPKCHWGWHCGLSGFPNLARLGGKISWPMMLACTFCSKGKCWWQQEARACHCQCRQAS